MGWSYYQVVFIVELYCSSFTKFCFCVQHIPLTILWYWWLQRLSLINALWTIYLHGPTIAVVFLQVVNWSCRDYLSTIYLKHCSFYTNWLGLCLWHWFIPGRRWKTGTLHFQAVVDLPGSRQYLPNPRINYRGYRVFGPVETPR